MYTIFCKKKKVFLYKFIKKHHENDSNGESNGLSFFWLVIIEYYFLWHFLTKR